MRMCKKILPMLSIFSLCVPFVCFSQALKTVDFERLISNHPLMKQFDRETGRFKGTPSEILPLDVLQQRVGSLTSELEALEARKAKVVATSMLEASGVDEERVWDEIGSLDRQIAAVKGRLLPEQTLLEQKGVPGLETVFTIATGIVNDVVGAEFAADRLVINKLPRYPSEPPTVGVNDLRRLFYSRDRAVLEKYLTAAPVIGLMFSGSDRPVLYAREGLHADENK